MCACSPAMAVARDPRVTTCVGRCLLRFVVVFVVRFSASTTRPQRFGTTSSRRITPCAMEAARILTVQTVYCSLSSSPTILRVRRRVLVGQLSVPIFWRSPLTVPMTLALFHVGWLALGSNRHGAESDRNVPGVQVRGVAVCCCMCGDDVTRVLRSYRACLQVVKSRTLAQTCCQNGCEVFFFVPHFIASDKLLSPINNKQKKLIPFIQ